MGEELTIQVVIPAYEPDDKLIKFCKDLHKNGFKNIIVVNDGSSTGYDALFYETAKVEGCTVLRHAVNQGKGRALKTNQFSDGGVGCITADSDGQHKPEDVLKCAKLFYENTDRLIMGSRNFDSEDIPWKSKLGNELTKKVCSYLCGIKVSDTQTGLRGIPHEFMKELMNVPGERFEFETNMLIETQGIVKIDEIPIQTIYDSKENHKTHFDPIRDSIKIYRIFGRIFTRYIISSLSSSVLDLLLFVWFCNLFHSEKGMLYIGVSTVMARIFSAVYNYLINYKFVFASKKRIKVSSGKYFVLELVAPAGFLADTEKTYEVNLQYADQQTPLVWKGITAKNQAISVEIDLRKVFETGFGTNEYAKSDGAVFGLYNAKYC